MAVEFDVAIVGSGPAGVSAAYPLLQAGLRVVMIDAGRSEPVDGIAQEHLAFRRTQRSQWRQLIGADFHAVEQHAAVSPKLRVPTLASVFRDFELANQIDAKGFVAVGSLAQGGLSNAWGCGVARLSADELAEFPFGPADIEASYENVTRRMGISGCAQDDLSDYFGLDQWAQPPIPMDDLHTHIEMKYRQRRSRLQGLPFRLGRSRVAALSVGSAERGACDRSGNCLWGCDRRALYSASEELPALARHPNFRHETGFVVDELVPMGPFWSINGMARADGQRRTFRARKVVLAAGTLATTRLALKALGRAEPVKLLSCPTAAFLLWIPRLLGSPRVPAFGLGQLSFTVGLSEGVSGFGSTFSTHGIPVTEFARHLPVSRRYGVDLLRHLLSSCLVGNLFLPGRLSTSQVQLLPDGRLRIEGGFNETVPRLMQSAAGTLRRAYRQIGALMLPRSFTVGAPGADIHYAGTLPMRSEPVPGQTSATGELFGCPGVHVADGACLSALSEKSHTLTIMANADRIGRALARVSKRG